MTVRFCGGRGDKHVRSNKTSTGFILGSKDVANWMKCLINGSRDLLKPV